MNKSKITQEIEKTGKGCGKGRCGINFNTKSGDNIKYLCPSCQLKLQTLKFCQEEIKKAIEESRVDDGYDINTASCINNKLQELQEKLI
ncbi:MAG: hypothetical protein KKD48_04385 [Nanoarchaeota archaeon]|nr:hypothetical protein [Nanoarchaeota archaeon]